MAQIHPYQVKVPDIKIETLKRKLKDATYIQDVEFADDWDYGAPLSVVKRLAARWADGFDWRAAEAEMNQLPQFTTRIHIDGFEDLEMHFVHQKSSQEDSIPLLFAHGWPGSFLEVQKLLPLLTDSKGGQSFHVVAPSLPNFGFSQGSSKKGFGLPQYAEAMHKVMLALGYNQYVTQGGDWGFKVTRYMGYKYPEHCLASHLNLVLAKPPKPAQHPWQSLKSYIFPLSKDEKEGMKRTKWFEQDGFGYNLLQSTKPATIGHALADSPVAVLAWIYEKLHDWTDGYPWTDDEILTWVSIYWFSRAGPAASARIYYEIQHPSKQEVDARVFDYNANVKLGLSYFPKDIFVPPSTWGRTLGPVVSEVRHGSGGHFAAHERPELLAQDVKRMFAQDSAAYSLVRRLTTQ